MAEREITVKLNLKGNVDDELVKIDKDTKRAVEEFKKFESSASLGMDKLAKGMGLSREEVEKLSKTVKEDFALKTEMKEAAKAAGLTDKELNAMTRTLKGAAKETDTLANAMQGVAGLAIAGAMQTFAAESLHAGIEAQKTETILKNLSGEGFEKIDESISKVVKSATGLSTGGDLQKAASEALKLGASADFITKNLGSLNAIAETTGGTVAGMMTGAQNSITSGNVEFLKQNAILSKHAKEFQKIGEGVDEVTKKRREMFLTKILSENDIKIQQQFQEFLDTGPAQFRTYNQNIGEVKEGIGKLILNGITPLLKIANKFMSFFLDGEAGAARLKIAFLIIAPLIGTVFVVSLLSSASAALTAAKAVSIFGMSLGSVVSTVLIITGVLLGLYLIIEDLWVFSQGGKSVFEDFLGWLGFSKDDILAAKAYLKDLFDGFSQIFDALGPLLKEYGKEILGIVIPIGIGILTFMFPFIMIPILLAVAAAFIVKYWAQIKAFFINGFNVLMEYAIIAGKALIMVLFPFSMLYFFWDEIMGFFKAIPDKIIALFTEMGAKIKEILRDMLPESFVNGLKAIGIDLTAGEARADGGPVETGKTYLVGERGPEIFKPKNSGEIIPNNKIGNSDSGGMQLSFNFGNIFLSGSDSDEMAQDFVDKLRRSLPEISREIAVNLGLALG